jgi:hypothetical protein
MSEVKVNKISPRTNCGTVQLGDSGDTITIPAGATIVNNGTQTGFGRTGTVDWDTTAKTASFTAVSGNGYFVNTTSAAITLTLPATPSAGDIVAFKDYAFTFATNNLTVDGNGSPIGGVDGTQGPIYSTNGTSKTFIYVDGTKGWLVTNESTDTSQEITPTYITATGGTVTCCGDYKIHTFTGPGTFTVCSVGNPAGSDSVEYIVVAGGGGGGSDGGGGGGAGGFRFASPSLAPLCYPAKPVSGSNIPVTATGFPITVGAGGGPRFHPDPNPNNGIPGSNSIFSTITATGGGGGGNGFPMAPYGDGGSGGGARGVPATGAVGQGNTPPTDPPQGQPGGPMGPTPGTAHMGGGGGALNAGSIGLPDRGGPGGDGGGVPTAFGTNGQPSGSFRYYAGGGGGATDVPGQTQSAGGLGGGGIGVSRENGPSVTSGTANTGGGGGGGGNPGASGSGGSGIIIIRYKYQ